MYDFTEYNLCGGLRSKEGKVSEILKSKCKELKKTSLKNISFNEKKELIYKIDILLSEIKKYHPERLNEPSELYNDLNVFREFIINGKY